MSKRERRAFSPEFKARAVELVKSTGKSVGPVAKDFDLTETALREWVKQPGWKNTWRVKALPDGTFNVNLDGLASGDFSVLKGQPVLMLDLQHTGISDLSSLAGLASISMDCELPSSRRSRVTG